MKFLRNIFLITLSFMIAISSLFSTVISAEEIDQEVDSEEVEELAEQLEFMFEEASIKDDNGNIIGFDFESIEEKYGTSIELDQLKQEIEGSATDSSNLTIGENSSNTGITTMAVPNKDKINACIQKKVKNSYKETLTLTTINTLWNLARDKKYKTLAKKLLAVGIKGNVPGIAIQLMYYHGTCVYKYNGW